METILILVFIAFFVMIAFLIMLDIKTLNNVIKLKINEPELKINDEKYYELKFRIQLLTVVSSIIIAIGGFIGYTSIKEIKDAVSSDVEIYKSKLMDYDSMINGYDTTFIYYAKKIEKVDRDFLKLLNEYRLSYKSYVVGGIKVPEEPSTDKLKPDSKPYRLYFNQLETKEGTALPSFKEPPFLAIQGNGIGVIMIENITKDYFEYGAMRLEDVNTKINARFESFDLLIVGGNK